MAAGVVTFDEEVHGFTVAVLADGVQVIGADGSAGSIRDIKAGTVIQVTGPADGAGGVLAKRVRIVSG